jgi:hypothetical protein
MLPRVLPKGFESWENVVKGLQIMREMSILPEGLIDTVVISIVTRLPAGLSNSDSIPNSGMMILNSPPPGVQTDCVPRLASSSTDTDGSFPGTTRSGREADQLPAFSAEDKSEWNYSSTARVST